MSLNDNEKFKSNDAQNEILQNDPLQNESLQNESLQSEVLQNGSLKNKSLKENNTQKAENDNFIIDGDKDKTLSQKTGKSKIKKLLTSKKIKHGTLAMLLTAVFIVIVIIFNIICSVLVDKFPVLSSDLTENSAFELQDNTKKFLESLQKDITITFFTDKNDVLTKGKYYIQAEKLLKQIAQYSKTVTLKYLDLAADPTFTQKYPKVDWSTGNNFAFVECGDRYFCITEEDAFTYDEMYLQYYGQYSINGQNVEQSVVTAILNVTSEKEVKVGFVSDVDSLDTTAFEKMLKNNAYTIENVSLLSGEVPQGITTLVLFAPSVDLTESSVEAVGKWLSDNTDNTKSFIYVPIDRLEAETPNLDAFLEEWGIAVSNNYIYEQDTSYMVASQAPYVSSVFDYSDSDTYYKNELKSTDVRVYLPYCMSVEILDESKATPLLVSSSSACKLPLNAGADWTVQGVEPQVLNGAVVSSKATDGKSSNVFVIGSYDAFTSSILSASSFNNSSYFMSIFNNISDKNDFSVSIEGNNIENAELGVTTTGQVIFYKILLMGIIPFVILLIGLVVWIIRRNK